LRTKVKPRPYWDTRPPPHPTDDTDHYHRLPRREVFLVLEFDGPAYRRSLALARKLMAAARDKDVIEDANAACFFLGDARMTTIFRFPAKPPAAPGAGNTLPMACWRRSKTPVKSDKSTNERLNASKAGPP